MFISTDQFRTDDILGTRVTSSLDSQRWFLSGNLNYTTYVGNWLLSGRGGLVWAKELQDGFVESDGTVVGESAVKAGRATLGAEIAYAGASFEPFVGGTFEYDFIAIETTVGAGTPVPDDDRSGGVVNIGARYFNNNGISASFQYSTLLDRGTLSEHSVDLFVRMDFN